MSPQCSVTISGENAKGYGISNSTLNEFSNVGKEVSILNYFHTVRPPYRSHWHWHWHFFSIIHVYNERQSENRLEVETLDNLMSLLFRDMKKCQNNNVINASMIRSVQEILFSPLACTLNLFDRNTKIRVANLACRKCFFKSSIPPAPSKVKWTNPNYIIYNSYILICSSNRGFGKKAW